MKMIAGLWEFSHRALDPSIAPLALLSGLVLTAVALSALSFLAVFRSKAQVRDAEKRVKAGQESLEAMVESLRESQNSLAAQVREMREQPPIALVPGSPKAGLNLTTRSQALRMNRRGDPPDRIAAALNIPLQEVDLLLKVHRIVITNI
jgi:hypothetical protein